MEADPTRRRFLSGAGAVALAGLAAACAGESDGPQTAQPADAGEAADPTVEPTATEAPLSPTPAAEAAVVDVGFHGVHQPGLLVPSRPAGIVAAFDVAVSDRTAVAETFRALSGEIERLMTGGAPEPSEEYRTPVESGVLGGDPGATGIAITLAVGATLFDGRFGLEDRRPSELIPMPRFRNDRFVDPSLSHGDVAVLITAPTQQAAVRGLHQLVRVAGDRLSLRWVQEGYNDLLPATADGLAEKRNLMGFLDGTSNLDTADDGLMDEHVWVNEADGEPPWATGGTYLAVRTIRMLIEFWGTAALVRQEQIFGRHRDSGAPLGQSNEADEPAFATDQADEGVPFVSHMRRANPRTPGTGRILRRGFSYLNGVSPDGTMDQGLLFLSMQRRFSTGFVEIQARLDGEPLEDYVKPVGGGFYFALPGVEPGGWLGEQLLA